MDPAFYEQVFRLQKSHWWYLSRMRFLDVLMRCLPRQGMVLDAGCGPGSMLHYLGKYGTVTGMDNHLPALALARTHFSGGLVAGDCSTLPFPDGRFSLVAANEVLYHRSIQNTGGVMREFARVLEPGGYLLVVDSAYASCASDHDRAAHGARRFNRQELVNLFREAGFEIFHATYAYSVLFPVVWLVRRWKKLIRKSIAPPAGDLKETAPLLNSLIVAWFTFEAQLAGRLGLPFGLSIQILGRKPLN